VLTYEEILQIQPYSLNKQRKDELMTEQLLELTQHHMELCSAYKNIIKVTQFQPEDAKNIEDIPFLPVRVFKDLELKSVSEENTFKTMTSSGTTGQKVSKIFLDKETSANQQKTLVKIVSDFTGKGRLPLLIIDCPSVVKNRAMFSARGAGILGFSIFASDRKYALDDDMNIDVEGIQAFMKKYKGQPILMFGFTFMIWQHFYKKIIEENIELDIMEGILIHGGGWKKLEEEAVSALEFKQCMKKACGISKVYDYYGMVEQTGCIYMECEYEHLHSSIFSDVIMRRQADFSVCDVGERGIIQVLSMLPKSYPGHSILTEDEGILLGVDNCPCGRLGKYFKVEGRLKNAEIRGCSDTYERR
jgi:phenylacetate-coenzyme A ligase PaaK-like adenylate-forming protein